ncbi:hypothetical protein ACVGWB_00290, partial [Enterobacter mori]
MDIFFLFGFIDGFRLVLAVFGGGGGRPVFGMMVVLVWAGGAERPERHLMAEERFYPTLAALASGADQAKPGT